MRLVAKIIPFAVVVGILALLGYPLLQRAIPGLRPSQTVQIERPTDTAAGSATTEVESLNIITVLPKDAIRSIDLPRFVSPQEASAWMRPEELVIGVSIEGDSRAYALNMLSRHEIVNDVVGGRPVAVTW